MPRSKAQNEHLRAERRQAILEAAIPLFTANGFSATSISEIAKAAGVSHGTVFLYFATKEELFRAALVEPLEEAEQHFLSIATWSGTPLERIRRMVHEQVYTFSRKQSYLRLTQYVLGQPERFPELAQHLYAFSRRYQETLRPIVEEGQALGELAPSHAQATVVAYFAYLNGLMLVVSDVDDFAWNLLIEHGIRIFGPLKAQGE